MDALLRKVYENAQATKVKSARISGHNGDFLYQRAKDDYKAQVKSRQADRNERIRQEKFGTSKYELDSVGIIPTIRANTSLAIDNAWASTKGLLAQAEGKALEDAQGMSDDFGRVPDRFVALYDEYNANKQTMAKLDTTLDAPKLKALQARQAKLTKVLNQPSYGELNGLIGKGTKVHVTDETFLQRLNREKALQDRIDATVGDAEKGIPDAYDSRAKVNPYYDEKISKHIEENQDAGYLRVLASQMDSLGTEAFKQANTGKQGLLKRAALYGEGAIAKAVAGLEYLGDNVQHGATVANAYVQNPGAIAQLGASSAPYAIGGPLGIASTAYLQANADAIVGEKHRRERTGQTRRTGGEKLMQDAAQTLNFGANFAENLMLNRLAKGGSSREFRNRLVQSVAHPTSQVAKAVPTGLRGTLASVARPVTNTAKDVGAAFAVNTGAGYLQSKVQHNWSALDFETDNGRQAIEDGVAGGMLAGAMATPSATVSAVGDIATNAKDFKTKATATRQATFEENTNPEHEFYNPSEAIAKQVAEYHAEDATDEIRQTAMGKATHARDVAQEDFAKAEKTYKLMNEELAFAKELQAENAQAKATMQADPSKDFSSVIDKNQQFIDATKAKYGKGVKADVTKAYEERKQVVAKAQTAFEGFKGIKEVVENKIQTPEQVKENVQTLTSKDSTPEQKASATEHVRSFPMAYKPEQLKLFADDLTNDLTDAQRVTLREFSEEIVKDHLNKNIGGVTSNLIAGGKGYRKLGDYFTLWQQAVQQQDDFTKNRLITQLDNLKSSFDRKADLAQRLHATSKSTGKHFQVIRTEQGEWRINSGMYLDDEALRVNGGFNIKPRSTELVSAIAKDAARVAETHKVFSKITDPSFTGVAVAPKFKVDGSQLTPAEQAEHVLGIQAVAPKASPELDQLKLDFSSRNQSVAPKPDPVKAETKPVVTAKPEPKAEVKTETPKAEPVKDTVQIKPTEPVVETPAPTQASEAHTEQEAKSDTDTKPTEDKPKTEESVDAQGKDEASEIKYIGEDEFQAHESDTHVFTDADEAAVPALKGIKPKIRELARKGIYTARNLVQAYFKQGGSDKGLTALAGIPNFVETILKAPDAKQQIEEALKKPVTDKQMALLNEFIGFHDTFTAQLDNVFTYRDGAKSKWQYQDLAQFLVDENKQLPANVKTAIAVSAFQWILQNGSKNQVVMTDYQILKNLNLPTDAGLTIPVELRQRLGTMGTRQNVVIASIGANIVKSLQLGLDKKADPNYMGRMESSLGALALHAMEADVQIYRDTSISSAMIETFRLGVLRDTKEIMQDAINQDVTDVAESHDMTKQVFIRVAHATSNGRLVEPNERTLEYLEANRNTQGFLEDLFGLDSSMIRPTTTKPEKFTQKSIKKSKMTVPSKEAKNAEIASQKPYSVREPVVKLFQVLHDKAELQLKVMLGIDDSETNLKGYHAEVRGNTEAKFKNEWASLENALEYMNDLGLERTKDGTLPQIYFPMSVWSNQRLGYTPNMFNIQTSQIHRAMAGMSAHHTKIATNIDMFGKDGKVNEYGTWLRAIASGAEDVKSKLVFPDDYKGGSTVDKAESAYFLPVFAEYLQRDEVQENIDAMGRILDATAKDEVPSMADVEKVGAQVAEFGMGAHSLLVLTELAQFKKAREQGVPHQTTIGIETDGVTNGPAIANTLAGALTHALAMQFGLVPKAEGGAVQYIKNYLEIKSAGTKDYYQTFGNLQLEFIERILDKTTSHTQRGVLAQAMAELAGGFGDRGSAKKWATPFNYAAGYPALKAALARELKSNILNTLAKIAKQAETEPEKAQQAHDALINHLNIALKYHNDHMQKIEPIAKDGDAFKDLDRIEREFKMLNPDADIAPRPKDYSDKEAMLQYLLSLGHEPKYAMKASSFIFGVNSIIRKLNTDLPRASGEIDLVKASDRQLTELTEFNLTPYQWIALSKVSAATHGLASEHAIKVAAKDYIKTRDLNIALNNIAFNTYETLRNAMIKKVLDEKRKAGLIPTVAMKVPKVVAGKLVTVDAQIEMEGLSKQELDQIAKDLMPYAPVLVSSLGLQSDNPLESGLFMSKQDRGFDTERANAVKSTAYYDGKLHSINTGVSRTTEVAPGVRISAMTIQSVDARIASNMTAQTDATNVHDAGIAGIRNYAETALIQNKEFFNAVVDYRMQVETLNAMLRTINGLAVGVDKYNLHGHVAWKAVRGALKEPLIEALVKADLIDKAYAETITQGEALSILVDAQFTSERNKIKTLQGLYAIHQYGGEGGEFVLGEAEQKRLADELAELEHEQVEVQKSVHETTARMNANRQIKEVPTRNGDVNDFQRDLNQFRGKEIPVEHVLKLLKDTVKNTDGVHAELLKVLAGILPENLKFKYVTDDWVGQKNASGWFNPKTNTIAIRATGSKFNYVTPELFLHEMVHAALVGLTAPKVHPPKIEKAIARIEALRTELIDQYGSVMPEAFANKEEFMAYGLTNPKFQNLLKGIVVTKGERNRKGFRSAFSKFVHNVVDILFHKSTSPNSAKISAIEALLIDSAEVMNFIVTDNPNRVQAAWKPFNMIRDVDEVIQEAKTVKPVDLLDGYDSGALSDDFKSHLRDVVSGPITQLFNALGTDHLDDLTKPVDYTPKEFATIHGLTEREEYVAEVLATVVETAQDSSAHTPVLRELHRAFAQAREQLTPADFHDGDWSQASQSDRSLATQKYDHIFAPHTTGGKNSAIANFVGLALGSEKFNSLLNFKLKEPKKQDRKLLQKIHDMMDTFVNWLANTLATRSFTESTMDKRVAKLTDRLVAIDVKARQQKLSKFDKLWDFTTDSLTALSGKGAAKVGQWISDSNLKNSKSRTVSSVAKTADALRAENLGKVADAIQMMRDSALPNTPYGEMNEIVNEIREPNDFKKAVEKFLRESVIIQNTRKSWIDITKRAVTKAFSNEGKDLTKDDHTAITHSLLRTDVQSLLGSRSFADVINLVRSKGRRANEITRLSNIVSKLSNHGNDMVNRAHDLGHYMATGNSANGLAKNAQLIAQGFGTHYEGDGSTDPKLVKAIDDLASLYALNYVPSDTLSRMATVIDAEMARTDGNGIEDLLKMHKFLFDESKKEFADNPLSMSKGYMPEITHSYRETALAPLSERALLERQGYVFVGEVALDPMDHYGQPQGFFVLKDGGIQRIVSGAVTFDATHSKGNTLTDGKQGAVTAEFTRATIAHAQTRSKIPHDQYKPSQGKSLVPQYDANGQIMDFHYEMSSAMRDTVLVRNNNFGDLLGAYAGSNSSKQATSEHNVKVLNALFDDYKSEYKKNPRAYVAIGPKSSDPRLAEIWRLLPFEAKEEIENLWGVGNPMMIRNDLVNVSFGFKKYSVSEMFDKESGERNWAEKAFVGLFEIVAGVRFKPKERAQLYAVRSERFIQEVMKKVKDIIVIRTVSVLWGNIKANALLHLAYGVNPVALVQDSWLAVRAGLSYKKQRALLIQAEEALRANIGDSAKWEQQLAKAQDAIARNPLLGFIESGMMPSIVEDVELNQSDYTYTTELQDKFDKQISRVPKSLRTAGNWMMISPDTPAYKFLAGATQFSDFTAKYALYKHLTTKSKQPMDHDSAIQEASDAFINYDVPTTRALQYVNDMGLIMFTKFFLRFQRVLYKLLQTRPALALAENYATEWFTNTPGVLEPSFVNRVGNPFHSSILQAPGAVADIATFKTLF